jgi:zinc protease
MPKTRTSALPIERTRLANGLRVVFAPDRSSPAVFVAAYYDVGFRSEPEGRTGFAHLFEHLMFQGSATLEKGMHDALVTGNGGILNGSTRNDFTNYFEMMPANALELALFLEADRMRAARLTPENLQNQVDVVKEEILVNVKNQPYGGFPWIYLPIALFRTFPNAHDAYGDFKDLDAATLEDAAAFFDRYYAPANAVLAVAGDVDPDQATAMIERHFGDIEKRPAPPTVDASEPLPDAERRVVHPDPHAPQPAVALAYRVPDPMTQFDDYVATVMLSSILVDGEAARLYQRLVKKDRIASHVSGDVGLVAGTFEVRGPSMLHLASWYPGKPDADRILRAIDDEIARVADGIEAEELDRFRSSYVADYLGSIDALSQRGMLVAAFEQQRGNAELINEIPAALARVEPENVARIAEEWLRPDRRAVVDLHPGAGS